MLSEWGSSNIYNPLLTNTLHQMIDGGISNETLSFTKPNVTTHLPSSSGMKANGRSVGCFFLGGCQVGRGGEAGQLRELISPDF